nr:MAK10-like protein [Tanacetum cinerariifolium]
MEAHLAPTQHTQVNEVTTSCEICSGHHDTQYCMEDPEQAFVEYTSSCTDKAGGGDGEVIFIELIRNNDNSSEGEPEEGGRIPTVAAAGQKDVNSQLHTHSSNLSSMNSKKTYNTASANLMYAVMFQDRVSVRVLMSQHHKMAMFHNKDD